VSVLVVNGPLDLAARAIVLQAFIFHLAIQNAATAFHCAGQMHRTRDARAVGCHSARFLLPFFGVNESQRIMTQNRARWRAASSEAFALYVIVAGCGRTPKTFPKRAHKRAYSRLVRMPACRAKPCMRCAARPLNVFYHEAPGDKKLRRKLRAEAAAGRGGPRRTREGRGRGVRYARTIVSALYVSQACMQSSSEHDVPHYTVQALCAREKRAVALPHAFGLLAIVAGWTWCAPTRGGRGVRDARTIANALHVS
jgi:hypothetical protein